MSWFCFRSRFCFFFFFFSLFAPTSFLLPFFFSFNALSYFSLFRFFFFFFSLSLFFFFSSLSVLLFSVARALTAQTICWFFFCSLFVYALLSQNKSREGKIKWKKLKVLLFLFLRERKREFRCCEWSREAAPQKKKKEKPRTQACNV